jgi:SNF2 family DNA or RNA helicase
LEQSLEDIARKISESDLDPITYLEIENPVITKCCKTKFDFESITIYILSKSNPLCPICRTFISKDKLIRIDNTGNNLDCEEKEYVEEIWNFEDHKKLENIVKIIGDLDNSARIIIFSEFDRSMDVISSHKDFNWKVKEIKGSASHINNVVDWFQDNSKDTTQEKKILFMNSRYAGAGLNLESGTDVFIYHQMNSDLTHQIIGRCQRPNRIGVLKVYNFKE